MNEVSNAAAILNFYKKMKVTFQLPPGVEVLFPFDEPRCANASAEFYHRFYNDTFPRVFIFGINPGRFGGGITGVPFTDPIRLESECGISNEFKKAPELSSIFIYEMIRKFGGPAAFYQQFYITAVSPPGYTKLGLNLNYYDDKELMLAAAPQLIEWIRQQQSFLRASNICICLGEGTNFKYFSKLNDEHQFFEQILPLPHPRWIMQYRRKRMNDFVDLYIEKLKLAIEKSRD